MSYIVRQMQNIHCTLQINKNKKLETPIKLMKEKIIQTAIELFNLKGFFDVKMRDISSALNISVGSVTYHFNNKEALMSSIHRYMIKTIDEMSISDRIFQKEGERLGSRAG